jgi:NAD(P)-dependent dehydrogenase (short-subunit alcohol dehydrogenase family)
MSSMLNTNLFSVAGKVVLITGGSRGLGEHMARGYVENGAKVYISSRKAEVCEGLADELSAHGACIALPADISRMEEIERVVAEISARESKLHVLVNNAGNTWGAPIADFPEKGWDRVMDLNVKSVFFLTQKLLPLLTAAATPDDWARVINIGSIEGLHCSELEAPSYSASKAAVNHLSRVMAKKLAKDKITVNAIAPGYFPTVMTSALPDELNDEVKNQTPMGRLGTPEDIAGLALFLSSRAGSYMTGAIIPIDGGLYTTS